MGYNTIADNAALTGIKSALGANAYVSLLNAAGTEVVAARKVITLPATVSGGSMTATAAVTLNVNAGATIHSWALYDAATGGNQYGVWALPADETFGSAGTYDLTPTFAAAG